ncbi:hypothetical protein ILYODFUR_022526 [Ilyodon furcidens]|uniref:Uncharacterized protein n=1 Tax=Ilyodon furcidens TaxID=33524 RepID=A0ABV0TWU0_9TELE
MSREAPDRTARRVALTPQDQTSRAVVGNVMWRAPCSPACGKTTKETGKSSSTHGADGLSLLRHPTTVGDQRGASC